MAQPSRGLLIWFSSALIFGVLTLISDSHLPFRLNVVSWIVSLMFIGYWNYAAAQDFKGNGPTSTATKKQSRTSRLVQLICLFVCGPVTQITDGTNYFRVIGLSWFVVYWIGSFLLILGLFWAIWARRTLGKQWRGHVEVRSDHQLITDGPYQITRHPIYTGGLMMTLGAVISGGGSPYAWAAFIFLTASILHKISLEEKLMGSQFKQYEQYKKTTPKLVPFIHFI